jgi:hypothetical protein
MSSSPESPPTDSDLYEGIDLRDIFVRLARGFAQTLGLAALGLVIAAVVYLLASPFVATTTTSRVVFAFDGFNKGEYPDHTKFQPDDLTASDIVIEALNREKLDASNEIQSQIRAALTVEGIIPANVVKERDRMRAAGQTVSAYFPDEYLVTLTLPRKFPLTIQQRETLLYAIVSAYEEKFQRTYATLPLAGNIFETLHNADYFEYDLILNREIQNISDSLSQQLDKAKSFRSPTTNLSFGDLLRQAEIFEQIQLNETLGLIRRHGLSRDRETAMVKMDYYMQTLDDQEQKAVADEKVVQDLLTKTQDRTQNYVLGIKSQAAQQRPEAPILDQGLVDSLLANDAYSFLVHKALDAGLTVKTIQAEKNQLLIRRKSMESFLQAKSEDQSVYITEVQKALNKLETTYQELIGKIRQTQADFARQQFGDAVRISMQPTTDSKFRPLAIAGIIGAFLGLAAGMGLSLLGVYVGGKKA